MHNSSEKSIRKASQGNRRVHWPSIYNAGSQKCQCSLFMSWM